MNNPTFNVNGKIGDRKTLLQLLEIRCRQDGYGDYSKAIVGYSISKKYGIVLYWAKPSSGVDGFVPFPSKMSAESVMPIINSFLDDKDITNDTDGCDERYDDGDVSNSRGWRIYCNEWGHVGCWEAFVAIKKVWLWSGK